MRLEINSTHQQTANRWRGTGCTVQFRLYML